MPTPTIAQTPSAIIVLKWSTLISHSIRLRGRLQNNIGHPLTKVYCERGVQPGVQVQAPCMASSAPCALPSALKASWKVTFP